MSKRTAGTLELPETYARALAWYRHIVDHTVRRRYEADLKARPVEPQIHLERLEYVEQRVGGAIPDFVLGWYAAGMASEGKWGAREFPGIWYVASLYLELQGQFDDYAERGWSTAFGRHEFVPFDYDDANYFLFQRGGTGLSAFFLDHETGLSERPVKIDVLGMLKEWGEEASDENADALPTPDHVEPLDPVLYSAPLDLPGAATEDDIIGRTVRHTTFGEGTVVERLGGADKFLVEFADGESRKMLGKFLEGI